MSRCCVKNIGYAPTGFGGFGGGNNICSLPCLIILILIVLQFSKDNKKECCDDDGYNGYGNQQIGNGILFIIALFFLSCVGCGRGYGAC